MYNLFYQSLHIILVRNYYLHAIVRNSFLYIYSHLYCYFSSRRYGFVKEIMTKYRVCDINFIIYF